jgi:regulator of cell morphogenesis and NO signaling
MMEREHQSAGDSFSAIRRATNDYMPPADACATLALTFGELESFERDLHKHIHLENAILFPKAITMEDRLRQ